MFEKEAEEYSTENWESYEEGQNDSKALKQAYLAGAEFGYNKAFVEADKNLKAIVTDCKKENAELKEKISVLLSCKNCPENKGGWICEKEYENKCLSQKIEFIKELEEENAELKEQIEMMKCCENCRHYSHTYGHCYSYDSYQNCKSLSNWELSEC